MRLAPLVVLGLAVSSIGCSLARGPLAPRAGFDARIDDDASLDRDAAVPDAPTDDAGPVDAPACVERCDGNTAVTCNLGHEVRLACTATVCDANGAYPMCLPIVCTPDRATCSTDATTLTACNHTGTMNATTRCDRGCAAGACTPQTACGQAIVGTLSMSGTMTIDLCGLENDHTDATTHGDCPTAIANGADAMYRLDLDRPRRVTITETSVDPTHTVDPIVYLRTACGVRSSEIDCNDNGTAPSATIADTLMAGEYFVIVDSFNDPGHTQCGRVSVSVAITAP